MRALVLLLASGGLTVYVLLGGLLFSWLEQQDEERLRNETEAAIQLFIVRNPCVNRTELQAFVRVAMKAKAKGARATSDGEVYFNNWNFLSAVLFATTVVTTIGYGSIVPITDAGRAVCVIYAIFGIPICLILLSGLGEAMTNFIKSVVYKRMGCCTKKAKAIGLTSYIAMGIVFFLAVPSAIFSTTQEWTFFEAMYFSVISLTTIGFGDYVLSAKSSMHVMRFFTSFWLFFGLAWVSSVIAMMSDLMLEKASDAIEKHIPKSAEVEDASPSQST